MLAFEKFGQNIMIIIKSIAKKSFLLFASGFIALPLLISCNNDPGTQNLFPGGETIAQRIKAPEGYEKEAYDPFSWASFLQNLPLLPQGSLIYDYTNKPISDQKSHTAVINYDTGKKDLQQCADAIIRLRAEHLFSREDYQQIQFKFTSGDNCKWLDYAQGIRPKVSGNNVSFAKVASPDHSYDNFRKYLDLVYTYAGTISLNRDLKKVPRKANYEIGDVIVKAGSPGHAVIIVDRAKDKDGNFIYLLAQGYTPAQSFHILNSGQKNIAPWFRILKSGSISSSRYYFSNPNIRRF